MSRFYASIQGSRGETTRQGGAKSGISGHVRGWNLGIRVRMRVDKSGQDVAYVTLTSGSKGLKPSRLIGTFTEKDLTKATN